MSEAYEIETVERDRETSGKTRDGSRSSSTSKSREIKEVNMQCFVKNIPSYVSCVISTGSNLLLSIIFVAHCVYYYNMHITLAILFVIANTAITFVGTFKANV
jgi:hypothetical protein